MYQSSKAERCLFNWGNTLVRVRSGLPQHEGRVPKVGIIFTDTDSALEYPDLFKQCFAGRYRRQMTSWQPSTQQYVKVELLSTCQGDRYSAKTYFRINNENIGQFERTLIIVDEGERYYVEGWL